MLESCCFRVCFRSFKGTMSFDLKKSHVEGFLIFKNQFDVIAKFVIVETSYNFNFIINFSSPYHATNKDRFFLKKF